MKKRRKKGGAKRPAPAANIQHSAMTGKAEKVYMMKREKRKVYTEKTLRQKKKRGSVVVVSDLSTWHYASPAHSKTVRLQSFDTAIPIAEPVLGGCPVVGHRIV
jgi:hypothetical protein